MRIKKVAHRRKREGKTDYRLRLKLLKSGMPRFVVRKSLKNIICQVVKYKPDGDITLVSADSKELKKFGWNVHCGNLPAAYLVGFLCGLRAKKADIAKCILDIGLYSSTKGSRLYAALKGALDAGLEIPHNPEILPSDDRIRGKHIAEWAKKLKEDGRFEKIFSAYVKAKKDPEKIEKLFEDVKQKIKSSC